MARALRPIPLTGFAGGPGDGIVASAVRARLVAGGARGAASRSRSSWSPASRARESAVGSISVTTFGALYVGYGVACLVALRGARRRRASTSASTSCSRCCWAPGPSDIFAYFGGRAPGPSPAGARDLAQQDRRGLRDRPRGRHLHDLGDALPPGLQPISRRCSIGVGVALAGSARRPLRVVPQARPRGQGLGHAARPATAACSTASTPCCSRGRPRSRSWPCSARPRPLVTYAADDAQRRAPR